MNACRITSADDFGGNVVSATQNPIGNSLDCQIRRRQPEEDEMNLVVGRSEVPEPGHERSARERCLKREAGPLSRQRVRSRRR
jgi:hypothetical protein